MNFKTCPFCGSNVSINNQENYLYCSTCWKRGIQIKITGENFIDIADKWNTRSFDTKFLENLDFISEYAQYLKNFGTLEKSPQILNDPDFGLIQSRMDCCGCFIKSDGTVYTAEESHENILKEFIGYPLDQPLPVELSKICNKLNFVRVSFLYKYISAYLPDGINSTQIEKLLDFCVQNSNWCEKYELTKNGSNILYTTDVTELESLIKQMIRGQ